MTKDLQILAKVAKFRQIWSHCSLAYPSHGLPEIKVGPDDGVLGREVSAFRVHQILGPRTRILHFPALEDH